MDYHRPNNNSKEFVLTSVLTSVLRSYSALVGKYKINGGVYSTERNDGLNYGTECFLKLKLAAYHCCTSYRWHFQQVTKRTAYPKKDKTNLRIGCGFLLVVISNEVLIVGIAYSMRSSSDVSSRELNV